MIDFIVCFTGKTQLHSGNFGKETDLENMFSLLEQRRMTVDIFLHLV